MTTFESLGVASHISNRLSENGMSTPTEIQAITIKDALEGKDICAMAGTGSGKTLAFLIPILQNCEQAKPMSPTALILVPTRELATQVRDVFMTLLTQPRKGQPRIAAIYGGSSMERQIRDLTRGVEVVVATPGRLIDLMDRRRINLENIKTVIIDEADRMADMGFLPPVVEILSKTAADRQTMLFSATLDGDVETLIKRHMSDPIRHETTTKVRSIDNMSHFFLVTRETDKLEILKKITAGARKTIVFVRTRDNADTLAGHLYDDGIQVDALHGNMRQNARERVLSKFTKGRTSVLVATDVAARGIDVVGLDLVVHYELPDDHKAYIHRSGRTARAGSNGAVVTLLGRSQMRTVQGLQKNLGLPQQMFRGNPEEPTLGNIPLLEEFNGEVMELDESRARSGTGMNSGRRGFGSSYGGNSSRPSRSYRSSSSGSSGSGRSDESRSYDRSSSFGRPSDASGTESRGYGGRGGYDREPRRGYRSAG
ncbi:DEAD/DEAH box helicase [Acidithrix ferrooxidans]|uniref:ATP-dependent RNA helicase RhlE n=1 Tax=Acidithrix ferrooxidans TaxID=1280514 RepID=A0A0D8HJC4_9ACTN|nr:DEAD/DEAH box helicase [Acidithrix ferrooxidans]KJF17191.1 ATP-dependent RNA helicase RhlE [Acidithrix ferrooxidans]